MTPHFSLSPSFWKRIVVTIDDGARARFIDAMARYFRAIEQQARDRELGHIPDVDSYMILRRDSG